MVPGVVQVATPGSGEGGRVKQQDGAHAVGQRVEHLLEKLGDTGNPDVVPIAEDLVGSLMEFYGDGIERIVELIGETPDHGLATMQRLVNDKLTAGILALHGLHPQDTGERVNAALDKVRPYLGSHAGGVEFLGIDEQGIVQLKLQGTCDGCPSSLLTVKQAIETAIQDAAPEVAGVEVEGVAEEPTAPDGRTLLPLEAVECPVPEAG